MNRRTWMKAGLAGFAMALGPKFAMANTPSRMGRVVIVGAGYGGATAAKYLRMWSQGAIEVVLIEGRKEFVSCPVSNRIFSENADIHDITHSYERLISNYGIKMLHAQASHVDTDKKQVWVDGDRISYDRLIMSTGIDFDYSALPMINAEIQSKLIPHAWKAGVQTVLLQDKIRAMPDGGVIGISIPGTPYRCPPGPYERACMIAFYLKRHKPKSKLLILDSNPGITSKRPLFERAWQEFYPEIIEYQSGSVIENINVKNLNVTTTFGQYKLDVFNLIPPQNAGKLTLMTGLANHGKQWCDVNFLNYESSNIDDVHVLGDSVSSMPPKSAHVATSQAKVCAAAIVAELSSQAIDPEPVFANTCYSFVDDRKAVHVANIYRFDGSEMRAAPGGGISDKPTEEEGMHANTWAQNIWLDVLS